MWFDSWSDILRVIAVGVAAYAALIVSLRVSGKRTLAQLNAFDFIVTVALGSTLATILLSSDVSFWEGAAALLLLVILQIVVAFVTSRSGGARKAVTAEPSVLLRDGRMDHSSLKRNRVSPADVTQAVRQTGQGDLAAIAAVILESNGRISVIPKSSLGDGSALGDLAISATRSRGR
ncbi:DUF421 domain-containing protein [Microbacterium sp. ET2]|uniref:DUF421 domain-containing protein n=1 Tax=Microbacterium albipurpureum TaxID=3050384 RepID=UPI00259D2212|nr:YetF domain-containing protein [Microbacterium sp. ET2 (Ac-2212)]WJL94867.1 DUF421 domain-containing protein [Microbacterium sp. ET2 (Ac-2212)]